MKCNYIKRLAFLVLPALLMPIASLAEEVQHQDRKGDDRADQRAHADARDAVVPAQPNGQRDVQKRPGDV